MMGPLVTGVAYLAIFITAVLALRAHPFAATMVGNVGLLLPPLALCVVVLRRWHEWRGCQRLFWATISIGAALWAVGHVGWAYDNLVLRDTTWLGWHTVFSLCGGIGPLIALFTRPYLGVRTSAVGSVSLGLASYGLLAVFVYSYFVLVPSLLLSQTEAYGALLALVQVNRALLLVAMLLTLAAAWRTAWRRTFLYLTVTAAIGAAFRAVTSLAIAGGEYQVGSVYDLAWILPFLGYLLGAIEAPASPREEEHVAVRGYVLPAAISAIPVLLIPLLGYGWINWQPLDNSGDPFRALLTGVMTVAGLGLLMLRLAAQGSELERADARLRLLAAATEQTAELILITRADGAIEHANDAFVRALGYSRAELEQMRFADLIDPAFTGAAEQIRSEVRARGIWRGTLLRRRRGGSMFPAACTVVSLKTEGGTATHYVGVERDISDETRLREQLVQSERLSAIGELVAGVAHEINNPLQTIIGSVELMMEERRGEGADGGTGGDGGHGDLELVRREAARAGQIVRNLLSFVRRGIFERTHVDLNAIVRGTVDLRGFHLQQRNIELRLALAAEPLPVCVNRDEIQQIVLNLLLNAEQAILAGSAGGTITIRTTWDGDAPALDVIDSGPGVGPDLGGRIFEPFFTTKQVGEGTGLGLSISHGIAAAHGGTLDLRPSSSGAWFRLTLPAAAPGGQAGVTPERPAGTAALVALIVDDEQPIRRLVVRLLERRGYRAFEAETGEAALALAARTPPDLVVCDVRMPGMNGPELYTALMRDGRGPRQFVLITGDKGAITDREHVLADVPVLAKPFTAADLDAVLAAMPPQR